MEMKRQISKIGIGGIASIGVIILLMLWFGNVYLNQKRKLHAELRDLFIEAMLDEKKQQKDIQIQKGSYDPQRSPNDISGEEKHAWCDQIYLTMHDPNRHLLDSLFQAILQKKNIEVKTAIRYIGSGKVINSSTDSLFYKNATLLNPVVYRIDENEEKNITLQAYVDVPIRIVLERIGWFWVISFVILILLAGGCGIYFNTLKEYIEKIIKSLNESEALVVQLKTELNELQAKKLETERISKQQSELIERKQCELTQLQASKQEMEQVSQQQAGAIEEKQAELTELQTKLQNVEQISKQQSESIERKLRELAALQADKRKMEQVSKQQAGVIDKKQAELTELQAKLQNVERINKQQLEMIEKKEAELLVSQNKIKSLFPKQKIDWIILPCGVLFDEKHGVVRIENGKTIRLKNNPLKLFGCFIKAEDYKLMFEDICTDVLERPIKNGLSDSDREIISTTVGRLRKSLKPFPCIEIKSHRKVGYQMVFSNYQNDTTLTGKSD